MKKSIALLFIIVVLIFSGCKNNSTNPTNAKEIWPLKVGNYWTMKIYNYDSHGNVTDTSSSSYNVVSDTIINGRHIYVVINDGYPNYYSNLSDGFYQYSTYSDTLTIVLKYPVYAGETYLSGESTIKVLNTNEQVVVPAGSFSSYHYENIGDTDYKTVVHCKPGVGIIKMEYCEIDINNNLRLVGKSELTSYKLN